MSTEGHDDRTMDREETEQVESLRERYRELLEELRTILPGVQVLLAFLLTAPFASRFPELGPFGRALFGIAVTSAAVATIFLVAPTSYHRLTRVGAEHAVDRGRRLRFSSWVTVAGMVALSISIISALLLVLDFVYGRELAVVLSAAAAAIVVVGWWVVPLSRRPRGGNLRREP